jgi:hypothetical protein
VLDLRDKETEGHTQRVTEMTMRLARALGVSEDEIVHIGAAPSCTISARWLFLTASCKNPARLGEDEWKANAPSPGIRSSNALPGRIPAPGPRYSLLPSRALGRNRLPARSKGEEIPLAARIFAIVDVWDALLSNRPYRKGSTEEAVLATFKNMPGLISTPGLVESFIELYNRGVFDDTQTSRMTRLSGRTSKLLNEIKSNLRPVALLGGLCSHCCNLLSVLCRRMVVVSPA